MLRTRILQQTLCIAFLFQLRPYRADCWFRRWLKSAGGGPGADSNTYCLGNNHPFVTCTVTCLNCCSMWKVYRIHNRKDGKRKEFPSSLCRSVSGSQQDGMIDLWQGRTGNNFTRQIDKQKRDWHRPRWPNQSASKDISSFRDAIMSCRNYFLSS